MSQQLTKIKGRIKTVTGAYKVTSAMKLVSTVRLRKYRNKMLQNKKFNDLLNEITGVVLRNAKKVDNPYIKTNDKATKNLYLIVSSTLGLCGSYNNNIFTLSEQKITSEDDAIILGNKGLLYFRNGEFNKIDDFKEYNNINDNSIVNQITRFISDKYAEGEYKEIHIIYTEYKNSIIFLAKDFRLLPLTGTEEEEDDFPPILEPTKEDLVETLLPLYLGGTIYAKLLESEVCEQASRANAMDNATENAKEILEKLQIEFNKARQAAITQEITEIVGASNAL